ncbi:unnamed protein product, partial [Tetraodon nigroviridis]
GSVSRPGPVPAFLRSPPLIPAPLDVKPFLQFPLESPHPSSVGLFHNFNADNTRHRGCKSPTDGSSSSHGPHPEGRDDAHFGPPMVKTKRPIISCNVCQIRFNSESQAEAHYKGNRHARRVKGMETSKTGRLQDGDKQQPPTAASPAPTGPEMSSPEPGASKQGTKHKTILEARSGLGPIKAYPRLGAKPSLEQGGELSGDPNTQERTFHCEICNVRVNSELQLKQELPKTLPAGLLPNPLAVAAAMAAAATSNQLALRPAGPVSHPHPHHHHLLQGTPLSLLRPAPGPIRTAHGPILFTPY